MRNDTNLDSQHNFTINNMINKYFRAQVLLEYIIIIGIVTIVLFAIFHAAKRGIQSVVKITADQVGNQQDADQVSEVLSMSNLDIRTRTGYLRELNSTTRTNSQKESNQTLGDSAYSYDESVFTTSNSLTDLGFSNRAN